MYEMQVEHLILRLEGRVFEVLSDQTDVGQRIHGVELDEAGFARFSKLVKIVHAARDAGPDPW